MKPSKSSKTAAQMALSRALESRKPTAERICFDPFAERFLDPAYRMLLIGKPLRDAVEKGIESLFPGHHCYVLVRTRYIDDFLNEQLGQGAEQVVILGAGYDSRAYRFAEKLGDLTVFEVDHPATSRTKRAKIQRILRSTPAHVRYVPVDFDRDVLSVKLGENGYRNGRKSVFLWEGTTPYVSASAVDDTLRFIASSSARGSAVLFDYILKSVIDGSCASAAARREHEKMKKTSEPFVFGIPEGQIGAFLCARGFENVQDVGAEQLTERLLRSSGAPSKPVKSWWRIAHATVS